jgi:hypothetical protein
MTAQDIKNKLYKYTPTFVEDSVILEGLYTAISDTIYNLAITIQNLQNANWTGKGLAINCAENQIYGSNITDHLLTENMDNISLEDGDDVVMRISDTDADYEGRLATRFEILSQRGTEAGILNDITNILGEPGIDVSYHDYTDSGIITGVTWFGKPTTFTCRKLIQIGIYPKDALVTDQIEKIINNFIKPIDVEIIYEV